MHDRTRPAATRREFVLSTSAALAALACRSTSAPVPQGAARLRARPSAGGRSLTTGITRITRDGTSIVVYLPASAQTKPQVPLFVFLHGALRTVDFFVDGFRPLADAAGVMVLAPFATQGTWDAIQGSFGPDVEGINRALEWVFASVPVHPQRVTLAGFSDGASYVTGLGRANGDLFGRLVCFSPGFVINVTEVGKPSIIVSHGTDDAVLPYSNSRDIIVPGLKARGYDVEFVSFQGPHAVLLSLAEREITRLGAP